MFCHNCGKELPEGARFCVHCGTSVMAAPVPEAAPVKALAPEAVPAAAPISSSAPAAPVSASAPAAPAQGFEKVAVRYRCDKCGETFDGKDSDATCPKCGAPLNKGGFIQIYRMGAFAGMAVGMGLYINNTGYGMLGNKQSLRISVPYGSHLLHVTHTTTRKCNDPVFEITPQSPYVWCKAHFSKGGFAIAVEQADPKDMPTE